MPHSVRSDESETLNQDDPKTSAGPRELPTVAIVGRPNVGKSTLFNRIVRGRVAIVDDEPGVTRDRNYRESVWGGKRFFLVDTGGLVPGSEDTLESLVRRQVEAAVGEAALVVFLVDATTGVTPLDKEIAQMLRRAGKQYLLVVNKTDTRKGKAQTPEFYELGMGDFLEISGEQGTGIGDLLDAMVERIPEVKAAEDDLAAIAVVGKPNVGKSSLVNRLTGTQTVIVDDKPGTTRDSIDTVIGTSRGLVRLVDTAGLRRKSKTKSDLEKYANLRSIGAIDRSDVVVLMVDSESGLTKQDLMIAAYVERSGKGMVLAWNKWDLHDEPERESYVDLVKRKMRHVPYIPVVFISCLTGEGVESLLTTCFNVYTNRDTQIPTAVLNRSLSDAAAKKPPPGKGKRFARIYYVTQTGTRPPTFTLFVNDPGLISKNYRRHLDKKIRAIYNFEGSPIRIRVRKSK
jgi:GTP-binding protein